ncbi:hypothetical protein SBA3_3820008 [Candidatus Sulfopaludibacter sp. SbA3]|nr:hypothetical protein SBA3_3820008 [Candidatus Sulfopaludibacter sp. SbA3]
MVHTAAAVVADRHTAGVVELAADTPAAAPVAGTAAVERMPAEVRAAPREPAAVGPVGRVEGPGLPSLHNSGNPCRPGELPFRTAGRST